MRARSLIRPALAASVVLAGIGIVRLAGAAIELARAIDAGHAHAGLERPLPLDGIMVRSIDPDGATAPLALASLADGLIFVFDPDCEPCNLNIANWLDIMVAAVEARVPLYALGVTEPLAAAAYWRPVAGVRPLVTDLETMERLGVDMAPSTLVVQRGELIWMQTGAIGAAAKHELMEYVRGARSPFRPSRDSGAGRTPG